MERFTQRARRVLYLAQEEAEAMQRFFIEPEHIVLGLLLEDEGIGSKVLQQLDLEYTRFKALVMEQPVAEGKNTRGMMLDLSPDTKRLLELAVAEARRMKHNYIGTEHLLLGLTRISKSQVVRLLRQMNISTAQIRQVIIGQINERQEASGLPTFLPAPETRYAALIRFLRQPVFQYFETTKNRIDYYNLQRTLDQTPLSNRLIDKLDIAVDEARSMNMQQVEVEHLILGLLHDSSGIWDKLGYDNNKIDTLREKLKASIESRRKPE
jgi:ATP-dependent Clp protease ATP-binding subunit ClpA